MHRYRLSVALATSALCAALAAPVYADDLEDLKRQQEELRKVVERQQEEIARLRREVADGSNSQGGDAAERQQLAAAIDELSKSGDNSGPVTWKQVSKQGSKFTLYGFLRVDAQYDTSRMNSTQVPAWVRSEDPTAPASIGAPDDSSDFNMHPKLTRLGLDFDGPTIASLNDAKVIGKLETDFYNATATSSRAALRMRHAYLKLQWGDETSILAGQTQDLISPLNPVVNNDFVMWGAGNLGDRRPQVRAEWAPGIGKSAKAIFQGMVGDTGAVDGKDLDPAGTTGAGYLDGQQSGTPTFQGRAAIRVKNWDEKDIEVGVWAHAASEEVDTAINGHDDFDSRAVGFDVKLPLLGDTLWVQGELWAGENLTDVRGGILQGVNTTTGDEIESKGGFVEVGAKLAPWLNLYGGYSTDNPSNGDLSAGGATGGRSLNKIWYAAARMNFNPVEMGLEWLHWKTEFIGFDDGTNDRVVAFVAYKF
jgi:hypothetical protein